MNKLLAILTAIILLSLAFLDYDELRVMQAIADDQAQMLDAESVL